MVPKIHSTGGHSFKGCMNYLLHGEELSAAKRDQAVQEDSRVAWSLTGNLGTQDPATASRVMAATAMNANKIKAEAGVSTRGKPTTKGDVMHYTLSWREDEIKGLSKAEMQSAAISSLKKLGKDTTRGKRVPKDGGRRQFADEHQYVIVCHTDHDDNHKHVHVVVNMTHPKTGRRLPTSNDQRKLSSWATAYQKKHGNEHLCPAREENRKARAREQKKKNKSEREFIKGEPSQNRKDWEQEKKVRDNRAKADLQTKNRQEAARFHKIGRYVNARQGRALKALQQDHNKRKEIVFKNGEKDFQQKKIKINQAGNQNLKEFSAARDADRSEFNIREKTFRGRLQNTWSAIKHQRWGIFNTEKDRSVFSHAFRTIYNLHANPSARFSPIQDKHDKIEKEHHKKVGAQVVQARRQSNQIRQEQLQGKRDQYQRQRTEIINKYQEGTQTLKVHWRTYRHQRDASWALLRDRYPQPIKNPELVKTNPKNVVPQSERGAALIDSDTCRKTIEALEKQAQQQSSEKETGKDEGQER